MEMENFRRRDILKVSGTALAGSIGASQVASAEPDCCSYLDIENGEKIAGEEVVQNSHPVYDNQIFNSSSVWHLSTWTGMNGKVHHAIAVVSYGCARDDNEEPAERMHNQWTELIPENGTLAQLVQSDTLARFGHEEALEEDNNPPIALAGSGALAMAGVGALLAGMSGVGAVVTVSSLAVAYFGWRDYRVSSDDPIADWAKFGNTDAAHTAVFVWSHNQNNPVPTCTITTMTGAAGRKYELTADVDGVDGTPVGSSSTLSTHSDMTPDVEFGVESKPLTENKRYPVEEE